MKTKCGSDSNVTAFTGYHVFLPYGRCLRSKLSVTRIWSVQHNSIMLIGTLKREWTMWPAWSMRLAIPLDATARAICFFVKLKARQNNGLPQTRSFLYSPARLWEVLADNSSHEHVVWARSETHNWDTVTGCLVFIEKVLSMQQQVVPYVSGCR